MFTLQSLVDSLVQYFLLDTSQDNNIYNFLTQYVVTQRPLPTIGSSIVYASFSHEVLILLQDASIGKISMPVNTSFAIVGSIVDHNPADFDPFPPATSASGLTTTIGGITSYFVIEGVSIPSDVPVISVSTSHGLSAGSAGTGSSGGRLGPRRALRDSLIGVQEGTQKLGCAEILPQLQLLNMSVVTYYSLSLVGNSQSVVLAGGTTEIYFAVASSGPLSVQDFARHILQYYPGFFGAKTVADIEDFLANGLSVSALPSPPQSATSVDYDTFLSVVASSMNRASPL